MAIQRKKPKEERVTVPIAPMIDCVFLMLIYFMVTSSLQQQEADIAFQLPGVVEQTEALDFPDEQIIEILANGQPVVNEYAYDGPGAGPLTGLTAMLTRFVEASRANQVEAIVTIAPVDEADHAAIVRVMDACAAAGVENVNFALGEDV